MSLLLFKNDILFFQRILSVSNVYKGPLDGKWSADVDKADDEFDAKSAALKAELGSFDKRCERNIETLILPAQRLARRFLLAAAAFPLRTRIISATRTYAEQDALFAIGRTVQKGRHPVTKAKGGESNHNFSIAWDVGLFDASGHYLTGETKKESKAYADLAALVKAQVPGIEWGGDWKGFVDQPHYQLATGKSLKEVRKLFEAGTAFL